MKNRLNELLRHRTFVATRNVFRALFLFIAITTTLAYGGRERFIGPDSVYYMHASETFAHDGWFLNPPGQVLELPTEPMSKFPIGYPFALAIPQLFGVGALEAVTIINVLAVITITLAIWFLLRRVHVIWQLAAASIVVFSDGLQEVLYIPMSDPLYLALVLLELAVLDSKLRNRLLFAAIIAACIPMTRYAGLAIVGTTIIVLHLSGISFWRCVRYGVIALTPIALLLLHNTVRVQPTGYRSPSIYSANEVFIHASIALWNFGIWITTVLAIAIIARGGLLMLHGRFRK